MKKTEAGKRRLLDVNPFLNIKTFPDGVNRAKCKGDSPRFRYNN